MNIPNDTLINSVPAAAALRKVPGFNPLKYLRQAVSEKTGENVLKLDLRYKRLWFRLACPNGRMLLNPLRITDQMAIYEAMVYMSKDETEPMSRVTSTATAQDAPNGQYIQAAQDAALDEALENAGFGIQLCDLVEGAGRTGYGSEITFDVSQAKAAVQHTRNAQQQDDVSPTAPSAPSAHVSASASAMAAPLAQATATPSTPASDGKSLDLTQQAPIGEVQESAEDKHKNVAPSAPASADANPVSTATPEASASAPTPAATPAASAQAETAASEVSVPAVPSEVNSASEAVKAVQEATPDPANTAELTPMELLMGKQNTVIPFPTSGADSGQEKTAETAAEPVAESLPMPQTTAEAAPSATYTADMTIEEIKERMTLDDAKAVVVQSGVCKGWTIAQVAERRAASLQFFQCAPFADNILKAASQVMLEQLKKAG